MLMFLNAGNPKLFYGGLEHSMRKEHMFYNPFEAQFVRMEPQSWSQGIAMQFELFGCGSTVELTTTPAPGPTAAVCDDPMLNTAVDPRQISFSSAHKVASRSTTAQYSMNYFSASDIRTRLIGRFSI